MTLLYGTSNSIKALWVSISGLPSPAMMLARSRWANVPAAAHEAANRAEAAAASAAATTASRYNPRTVANRIEKVAAEIRSYERDLDGYIAHRFRDECRDLSIHEVIESESAAHAGSMYSRRETAQRGTLGALEAH